MTYSEALSDNSTDAACTAQPTSQGTQLSHKLLLFATLLQGGGLQHALVDLPLPRPLALLLLAVGGRLQ